jgi:hypothetical protein
MISSKNTRVRLHLFPGLWIDAKRVGGREEKNIRWGFEALIPICHKLVLMEIKSDKGKGIRDEISKQGG